MVLKTGWHDVVGGRTISAYRPCTLAIVFCGDGPLNRARLKLTVNSLTAPGREEALAGVTSIAALGTPSFWVFGIASAVYGLIASGNCALQ